MTSKNFSLWLLARAVCDVHRYEAPTDGEINTLRKLEDAATVALLREYVERTTPANKS